MTEPTPHPVPQPAARPEPTPCSVPECNTDGNGEPCDRHETEQAHSEGEHTFCGVTCEVAVPSGQLRNFIVAKGYPGTRGALAELERRARTEAREAAGRIGWRAYESTDYCPAHSGRPAQRPGTNVLHLHPVGDEDGGLR